MVALRSTSYIVYLVKQPLLLQLMRMLSVRLIVLTLGTALARRFHDQHYHKHAHTYLQFCANATDVVAHACVHKVSAKWPTPAQLDPQECKEATAPFLPVGSTYPGCAGTVTANIYDPITIPMGLRNPAAAGGYRRGADVDTMTDWDRIRCQDGQLFATGCEQPPISHISKRTLRACSS